METGNPEGDRERRRGGKKKMNEKGTRRGGNVDGGREREQDRVREGEKSEKRVEGRERGEKRAWRKSGERDRLSESLKTIENG